MFRRNNKYSEPDGYINCNGQTSCIITKLSSQGDISCKGYKSCRYSKSIIAEGDIECSGWNSCDHQDKQDTEYEVVIFQIFHIQEVQHADIIQ